METRITFEIAGEQYTMFVEGILKRNITCPKKIREVCWQIQFR